MNTENLLDLFRAANKRAVLVGDETYGAVIGLDLEGRIFLVYDGQVVSRVNPDAIGGISDRSGYKNPGGDGLWPAPEGTRLGYEYSTGEWEVPIGLINARFLVTHQTEWTATIEAEVPLINAEMTGIPTVFRREVKVIPGEATTVEVVESIEYIGRKPLIPGSFLLAPWSLCQFDWKTGDEFVFGGSAATEVRDLYTDSSCYQKIEGDLVTCTPTNDKRYQVALGEEVQGIELRLKSQGLRITRNVEQMTAGGRYIDIADAPVDVEPLKSGVKYSFYNDPSNFLEIEAVGTCTNELAKGTVLSAKITTCIQKL